ncbi:MAG: LytTR family transcriptional regulator [Cyclobacteriaceae bacterium]|nr:LytTR family transcriptional regulator [Cyclobacteriaceae bacterium]
MNPITINEGLKLGNLRISRNERTEVARLNDAQNEQLAEVLSESLQIKEEISSLRKQLANLMTHRTHFFVRANNQVLKLAFADIQWIEALGDYVNFFTEKGRYVVHSTMKALEDKLPSDQFARAHRSYIVRLDKIDAIDDTLLQLGKKLIPMGEAYAGNIMSKLNFL